ncbi:MAG TPA: GNAT family N-acetyltransferase [Gaiellaceae bacterium]|nr:GNAT family N-acetyltransferase [Gaiellaceae bacterium]
MTWEGPPAPYRIETERLVIRCYEPRDAPLLKEAIDSSLEHLRPWMPWAHQEPQTLEQKLELVKQFRANFDSGENFTCGIFTADETKALGGTGLHPRIGPGGLEIGYWIRGSATRQGYATESSAALTRVGFEVCGADRIEIRIEPRNQASFGVPRKLGFVEEATLRRRLPAREAGPLRDVTIFTMFREDFDPSLAPGIRAFDARGEPLI